MKITNSCGKKPARKFLLALVHKSDSACVASESTFMNLVLAFLNQTLIIYTDDRPTRGE